MNRMITVLLVLACTGCTITVTPLSKTRRHVYYSHRYRTHEHPTIRLSRGVVDSNWLIQYRDLEEDHGNYRISDDSKVESVGDGKYRVTPAMLRHFRDLSQSP